MGQSVVSRTACQNEVSCSMSSGLSECDFQQTYPLHFYGIAAVTIASPILLVATLLYFQFFIWRTALIFSPKYTLSLLPSQTLSLPDKYTSELCMCFLSSQGSWGGWAGEHCLAPGTVLPAAETHRTIHVTKLVKKYHTWELQHLNLIYWN